MKRKISKELREYQKQLEKDSCCDNCEGKFEVIFRPTYFRKDDMHDNEMCSKCFANVCPKCIADMDEEEKICVNCYSAEARKRELGK